jgi:NADH-quinone oxidoreductase subunit G
MTQGSNPQHAAPSADSVDKTQAPPPPDTVNLTINGRAVTARKGTLLVEAAKQVGIDIPIFCYHPKLKSVGACRMCLVQLEKLPRLQTACTTPVAADMVVHTDTPEVIAAQNGVLELLLANHPLDCPICDKGGECPLQDNTFRYGPGASRFTEEKRHKEKAYPLGERIVLDRERCIMCYRCVRFHQEIPGDEALAAIQRGPDSEIGTLPGETYDSIFSGNTIELCPVGALTSRQYRFKARPWDLVRTPSICSGCAVGCNIEVHSRTETVLRLVSRENPAVDDGWLCDIGRFDTVPSAHASRPTTPLIRDGVNLAPVSWQEALARAAELLGPSGAVLASPSLSNEALWLLETALSGGSTSPQQEPLGRISGGFNPRAERSGSLVAEGAASPSPRLAFWPPVGGSQWPVQGAIANLARCKSVVLVGLDAWNELPIVALWIRKAVTAGATLIVIGQHNGLWRDTAAWFQEDELSTARALAQIIRGSARKGTRQDLLAAAAMVRGAAPAAVLAHPRLVASPDGVAVLTQLADALGATAEEGLLGAPLLAANGRGAQLLAPSLLARNAADLLSADSVLLLGDEAWAELDTGSARVILATSQPVADDPRLQVVLPLAHPYERQGTITNLEGRIQHQEGGASPPVRARPDWAVVAQLARQLGSQSVPERLDQIRDAMARHHPDLASSLQQESLVARV